MEYRTERGSVRELRNTACSSLAGMVALFPCQSARPFFARSPIRCLAYPGVSLRQPHTCEHQRRRLRRGPLRSLNGAAFLPSNPVPVSNLFSLPFSAADRASSRLQIQALAPQLCGALGCRLRAWKSENAELRPIRTSQLQWTTRHHPHPTPTSSHEGRASLGGCLQISGFRALNLINP